VHTLFQASGQVLCCIRKCIQLAKRKKTFPASKLLTFVSVESFILRLMNPMHIMDHSLLDDCVQCFLEIFEMAAFPQDVKLLPSDAVASHDSMMDVLLPRSFSGFKETFIGHRGQCV